jgi:hypothetical protein
MMISLAHCMPVYLYGSLQYFADVRAAQSLPRVIESSGAFASDPTPVSTNPERDFPVEIPLIVADINRGGR